MSTTRYIEVNSTYRNRFNYPCPSEFVVPFNCLNEDNGILNYKDPITMSYPLLAWYQVPYATSINEYLGNICDPGIRKINDQYYTSLWPLNIDLTNVTWPITQQLQGSLDAMKFSGGTRFAPKLNHNLIFPPNTWTVPGDNPPINQNIILNPEYVPIKDYFRGALLMRFKTNPSVDLNSTICVGSFNGFMESSIIASYDNSTGIAHLITPFSADFDPPNEWFLIDFNTDPSNQWEEYVKGGPRVFYPRRITTIKCVFRNVFRKFYSFDGM